MKEKEKYSKLIDTLRRSTPELQGKEGLEEAIMESIRRVERQRGIASRADRILFSWVEVSWMRRTLSTAAAVIIGLFVFQQVSMNRRINQLEEQVVTAVSATNVTNAGEPAPGAMERVLLNILARDRVIDDSITVSRSDLEELLRSYMEMSLEEPGQIREILQESDRSDLNL